MSDVQRKQKEEKLSVDWNNMAERVAKMVIMVGATVRIGLSEIECVGKETVNK